jgi:hypothetical protein
MRHVDEVVEADGHVSQGYNEVATYNGVLGSLEDG